MNKTVFTLLLFLFTLTATSQISKEKLLADYDFLVEELRASHQGLYQYIDKQVVELKIDSIRSTIKSSNKVDFFKKVNAVIVLTNEGHSGAELPFWTQVRFGLSKSFIPIKIEFSEKKAVLTKYFSKNNPGLQFGYQILAINGNSIKDIMEKLKPYIVTDGFIETSLYEWVSWNFPLYYALAYGKQKKFVIKIKKYGSGEIKELIVKSKSALKLKNKKNTLQTIIRQNIFEYRTISDSIGYLSIPNFYSNENFEEFYKKSFKSIKEAGIKHLIIDIQNNIGGNEGNENLLASYLIQEPYQKYESVLMPITEYNKYKDDKSIIADSWEIKDNVPHRGEFTLMSNYFSDFKYQMPIKELVYEGDVYVLTSGITFSGGAEFVSMLKMTDRAIFIGQESGGTYEGNVSGYNRYIKLPKTKIKIKIPIVHFKMNVKPDISGRGVMPDYEVPQSCEDIVSGKNSKFEFALKLIQQRKH